MKEIHSIDKMNIIPDIERKVLSEPAILGQNQPPFNNWPRTLGICQKLLSDKD